MTILTSPAATFSHKNQSACLSTQIASDLVICLTQWAACHPTAVSTCNLTFARPGRYHVAAARAQFLASSLPCQGVQTKVKPNKCPKQTQKDKDLSNNYNITVTNDTKQLVALAQQPDTPIHTQTLKKIQRSHTQFVLRVNCYHYLRPIS